MKRKKRNQTPQPPAELSAEHIAEVIRLAEKERKATLEPVQARSTRTLSCHSDEASTPSLGHTGLTSTAESTDTVHLQATAPFFAAPPSSSAGAGQHACSEIMPCGVPSIPPPSDSFREDDLEARKQDHRDKLSRTMDWRKTLPLSSSSALAREQRKWPETVEADTTLALDSSSEDGSSERGQSSDGNHLDKLRSISSAEKAGIRLFFRSPAQLSYLDWAL